jgi:hypothetical protein
MATVRGEKWIVVEIFLTGTNVRPSHHIYIKTIAVYHADMSSSHPFVPLDKMHLFMLFIVVFHTVAVRRRRMCYTCVEQEVESFILCYVFLRVLMCVSEYCFLIWRLLSQTLTFSINCVGRIVRGTERGRKGYCS